MKKYLGLIGAMILVVALASPSLAQDWPKGFKSWGFLEIGTAYIFRPDFNTALPYNYGNTSSRTSTGTAYGSGIATTPSGYTNGYTTQAGTSTASSNIPVTKVSESNDLKLRQIAERFRWFFQYGEPKTVRGVIGFEADSVNWGEAGWTDADAGTTKTTAPGAQTTSNPSGRMGTWGADQPQLEIKWAFIEFVVPSTPVVVTAGIQGYNYGGRLLLSKDMPGLTVSADFAPHKVTAYWGRSRDVDTLKYNVNDFYGVNYSLTQKLFNINVFGLYQNDLASGAEAATTTPYDDHPYWLGVSGGFRPGNFDFSAAFVYLGGKRDYKASTATDPDYRAWAAEAMAKYRIGPGLAVGIEGFYSTGADTNDATKYKRYTLPGGTSTAGSEVMWGFGNDRSIFFYYNGDFMYYWGKQLDFTGTWYGRANVEYNPVAWVNLNFNYLYIGDTNKGTPTGTAVINSPAYSRLDKDEKFIGHELNVIGKIKIYDSLTYCLGFGYFIPGDVYDTSSKSAEDAWSFLTRLVYTF
jgi:hypothetical protein